MSGPCDVCGVPGPLGGKCHGHEMGELHIGVYQSYSAASLAKFGVEALCRDWDRAVAISASFNDAQKSELEPGNTSGTVPPTHAAAHRAGTGNAGGCGCGDGPYRLPPNTVCVTRARARAELPFISPTHH